MKKWLFSVGGEPRYARWDGVLDTDSEELREQAYALIAQGVMVRCAEVGYLRKASFETKVRGWGTITRAVVLVADAGSIKFPFSYFNHSCIEEDDVEKAKFATRSEAARYAASIRWKGNVKGDDEGGGRDPVLEQAIGRARAMVNQLGRLSKGSTSDDEVFAADWGKVVDTLFVHVTDSGFVPTAPVMEVETEIRALGKMVYESLAKSGAVSTPEENNKKMLEAMRTKQTTLELAEVALKKVLSSPALAQTVEELDVLRREYTEASKAMRLATDEYNDNKVPYGNRLTPEQREALMRAWAERRVQQKLKARLKQKIDFRQRKIDEVTSNTVFRTAEGESIFLRGAAKHAEKTYQEAIVRSSLTGLDLAEAVTGLVSMYRGTGGQLQIKSSGQGELKGKQTEAVDFVKKYVGDIATHMPKEWVDDVNMKYGSSLQLTKSKGGGSWGELLREINTSGTTQVNLHEFIHAAMYANPVRQALEHAHLAKRTFGTASTPIDGSFQKKIVKGRQKTVKSVDYPTGESISQGIYIKDKWVDGYSGRMYESGGTEVVTVGYDSFSRSGWRASATLGKLDMEQVYLTLGLLMAS